MGINRLLFQGRSNDCSQGGYRCLAGQTETDSGRQAKTACRLSTSRKQGTATDHYGIAKQDLSVVGNFYIVATKSFLRSRA
jgi:hypothetical protein